LRSGKEVYPAPGARAAAIRSNGHSRYLVACQSLHDEGRSVPNTTTKPPVAVRKSRIQGRGVFATRRIRGGTVVIEYKGPRISPEKADELYDDDSDDRTHTFLFTVDDDTVIDATRRGGPARFINHSCEPNCRSFLEGGRVYIEAVRDIEPGEELTYDYLLDRPGRRTRAVEARYPCHCGSRRCRGTLLAPRKKRRAATPRRRAGAAS
jgi:SET domain-containing protein